jgi:hypothetical protein
MIYSSSEFFLAHEACIESVTVSFLYSNIMPKCGYIVCAGAFYISTVASSCMRPVLPSMNCPKASLYVLQ